MKRVLYTAAHSGFNLGQVPLGGGAAVCQHLTQEWLNQKPFEFEILGPAILGPKAPQEKDLVRFSELAYARFCYAFEKKLTERILAYDPKETVVLCNDVSEGPDFRTLAAKGFSIYTIYHVDVVDYFTTIYLRGWVTPEQTTKVYRFLKSRGVSVFIPKVLKLIWEKQEASVLYSKGLIVPSQRMKEVLIRCYPQVEPSRIHVLPWGIWTDSPTATEVQAAKSELEERYPNPKGASTLLTLSRISPEKGQDRLLKALALWEAMPDFPKEGVRLFIAGESAYMMGEKYLNELLQLAGKLQKCQVFFPGYAAGACKMALFELACIYVFPSKHESYGLTLLEALSAGLPVLATQTHGAKEVFKPEFGEIIADGPESEVPAKLKESLIRMLRDRPKLKAMGDAAKGWAERQRFSQTASKLAELLTVSRN